MSTKSLKYFKQGIQLQGETSDDSSASEGSLFTNSTSNRIKTYIEAAVREVVTNSQSQTLTNKTIDAASNTISNIANTNISVSAAIARSKLASGTANRVAVNDGSGVLSDAAAITASRALISDANGIPTHSVTTSTELSYVNGVTSAIQTQINAKADSSSLTAHTGASSGVHGVTGAVVGTTDSQTLTNKALSDSTTSIVDVSDPTKKILFDAAGTTGTATTLQGSQTANRTIILPDVAGTLITTGDTGTVTSTMIANDTIVNADINTAAAIARSKLASGTNYRIVANNSSGVMSENAALTSTRVPYADANGQLTDASDLTVSTNALVLANTKHLETQAATDSTTTGSAASLTSFTAGGVRLTNASLVSLGNIPAGSNGQQLVLFNRTGNAITVIDDASASGTAANRIITGTAANLTLAANASISLQYDSTTTRWQVIGGSGSGASASSGINYITNYTAEVDTTGWTTYADAAATSPVDGTGGSPTLTFTRTTSAPLRGTGSFLITKDAANRQGNGASYDFTIDASDKGKVLQCSFEYQIASGTFADNDLSVWIYDVTNASLIQPAPYLIKNSGIIEKFAVEFQTASNSTSYRLIIHTGSTSALAYTIRFDNWLLGPQAKLYGSAITDNVAISITGSWVTNTTYSCVVRREGDRASFEGMVLLSGAPTSTPLTLTLPSGYVIDVAKVPGGVGNGRVQYGTTRVFDSSAGTYPGEGQVRGNSTTVVNLEYYTGSALASITDIAPMTFATGDSVYFKFDVPIQGWGSSQVFSQDANVRVVAAKAGGSTSSSVSASGISTIVFPTLIFDSHGTYNTATGLYTVLVPGKYSIYGSLQTSAAAAASIDKSLSIITRKNGTTSSIAGVKSNSTASRTVNATVSDEVDCIAGDTLAIGWFHDWGVTLTLDNDTRANIFTIARIAGPAQIAASESVVCNYVTTAGQSIPSTTVTTVLYGTKIHDSHNAYNTSTGIFTAPMSGVYTVSASIDYTPNNTTGYRAIHAVGNSIDRTLLQMNALSIYQQVAGSTTFRLLAGQTINVYALHSKGSSETLTASDASNYMSIYRIGNY